MEFNFGVQISAKRRHVGLVATGSIAEQKVLVGSVKVILGFLSGILLSVSNVAMICTQLIAIGLSPI